MPFPCERLSLVINRESTVCKNSMHGTTSSRVQLYAWFFMTVHTLSKTREVQDSYLIPSILDGRNRNPFRTPQQTSKSLDTLYSQEEVQAYIPLRYAFELHLGSNRIVARVIFWRDLDRCAAVHHGAVQSGAGHPKELKGKKYSTHSDMYLRSQIQGVWI